MSRWHFNWGIDDKQILGRERKHSVTEEQGGSVAQSTNIQGLWWREKAGGGTQLRRQARVHYPGPISLCEHRQAGKVFRGNTVLSSDLIKLLMKNGWEGAEKNFSKLLKSSTEDSSSSSTK